MMNEIDYKDIYIKKIEDDKERLYNLVEKGLEIDEKNNLENQKTIRMIIIIFTSVILLICFVFAFCNSHNSNSKSNKNINDNTNTNK